MSSPLRSLQVITSLGRGGTEAYLVNLAGAIDRARVQLDVAYLGLPDDRAVDLRALDVPLWPLHASGWFDPRAVVRLRSLVRSGRYDLVNSHLPRADLHAAAALASIPGVRLVSTKHGYDERFATVAGRAVQFTSSLRADLIVAISAHMASMARTHGVAPWKKIAICHYGIPTTRPSSSRDQMRTRLGLDPAAFVIGSVGRLRREKGHRYLIEALPLVRTERPDAVLVLVGDGDERETLEALAAELRVSLCVRFVGQRDDAADLIGAFDIFALPSLSEGFGLVLLEAMRWSIPIVASALGAIEEVVGREEAGLLVPPKDAPALARAIASLAGDPARRAAMGARGNERLNAQFSDIEMARRTEALYREATGVR